MNRIHKKRLYGILFLALGLTLASGLILFALQQNINVFLTPKEITNAHLKENFHFRLGGMVKKHSLQHVPNSLEVSFVVTDFTQDITVHYHGILPDLFREGKGMIAEGRLDQQGIFIADQVLAKHDENYVPKSVYRRMQEQGDTNAHLKEPT
jgi:cytochrome c-type biogenesis protein CcmE